MLTGAYQGRFASGVHDVGKTTLRQEVAELRAQAQKTRRHSCEHCCSRCSSISMPVGVIVDTATRTSVCELLCEKLISQNTARSYP